jgi:AdoMet-dependent rRNA methyltransferase SPB1
LETDNETRLFDELKSHQRAQKKRERKLSKRLDDSKNHLDLAYDQELANKNDDVDFLDSSLTLDKDSWFSNPIFTEVLDEFEDNEVTHNSLKTRSSKNQPKKIVINDNSADDKSEPVPGLPTIDKDELVDLSFNRFAFDDDKEALPKWFVEDEGKHNVPQEPITKEVADLLREHDRLMKNRLPKKVLEAKNRQKMKALRKLQTMKKKASVIAESEDIGEGQKVMQIRKLLAKAKVERTRPKVVVAKGRLRATKGRPNGVKGKYKMVDRRMIKDLRAMKAKKSKSKK